MRECYSFFWKLWYVRSLGGVEYEGGGGFGEETVAGVSDTTLSMVTNVVSREISVSVK